MGQCLRVGGRDTDDECVKCRMIDRATTGGLFPLEVIWVVILGGAMKL